MLPINFLFSAETNVPDPEGLASRHGTHGWSWLEIEAIVEAR